MGVFDGLIGNWIQIVDEYNSLTVENYAYNTGITEGTTGNHCVKCVAVNQCYFKNEKGKKPEKYDYTGINLVDTLIKGVLPGLYHYRCHCKETPANIENVNDIQLIIPEGKDAWLFFDKSDWIKSLGYEANNDFLEVLYGKIKEAYFYGHYEIQNHTKYGVKIKLRIDIEGRGIKTGRIYHLKSSFMIFPNGKLKCNTLIGGWYK